MINTVLKNIERESKLFSLYAINFKNQDWTALSSQEDDLPILNIVLEIANEMTNYKKTLLNHKDLSSLISNINESINRGISLIEYINKHRNATEYNAHKISFLIEDILFSNKTIIDAIKNKAIDSDEDIKNKKILLLNNRIDKLLSKKNIDIHDFDRMIENNHELISTFNEISKELSILFKIKISFSNISQMMQQIQILKNPVNTVKARKDEWLNMIAKGEIETAVLGMINFANDEDLPELRLSVIHLSSRLWQLNNSKKLGIVNNEQYLLEYSKLSLSIIEIINELNAS